MATEASKTKLFWSPEELALFRGKGIDIGCGTDPIFPEVDRFDQEQGDANRIAELVSHRYDYVFSSHTLEHMRDPRAALRQWYELVKPGGHLIVLVPDEDLYEQGAFPSVFNADHTHTFTIAKARSWSPRSINVLELASSLGGEVVSVKLQDQGYDRSLLKHAPCSTSRRLGRIFHRWARRIPALERPLARFLRFFGAVIDQTAMSGVRLAQIQFIVRKPSPA
jgi:SAM-dependent methyltransferase